MTIIDGTHHSNQDIMYHSNHSGQYVSLQAG